MRKLLTTTAVAVLVAALSACGDGGKEDAASGAAGSGSGSGSGAITMGFAQVGSESGWRTANTKSIKESAQKAGFKLQFSDAQQKQENQIKAIRSYIQQKVQVIAFSPVVESGWDPVLKEAKQAGIPVILTDRSVDSKDTSLYKTFLGSDFVEEGKKAGQWLVEQSKGKSAVNVVQIEGTTGSAPANDRKSGFEDAIKAAPGIKVIASQSGDFTREGGKKVMEAFLSAHKDIDVLYAHNDDEALGAIEAIEAAGKVPGKDITIISVDATHDGMQALADGKISYIVECNPLLGPQLMDLAKKVVAGDEVPQRVVTEETVFDQAKAKEVLPSRQY